MPSLTTDAGQTPQFQDTQSFADLTNIINQRWRGDPPASQTPVAAPAPDGVIDVAIDEQRRQRRKLTSRVLLGSAFQVNTPVASEFLCALSQWLEADDYGAWVWGWSRLGKTSATRWVLKQLLSWLGCNVPWVEVPARNQSHSTDTEFFEYLLSRLHHRYDRSGRRQQKRDRVTACLLSRAQRCEIRTFILFIDEAQFLRVDHYQWLLNISNELNADGCRLFCIFVGQPPLLAMKHRLELLVEEQILSRFLLREHPFRGLISVAEVRSCLAAFDATEYPPKSGRRFPQNYVPWLCNQGWHLQDVAQPLWDIFEVHWHNASLTDPVTVPMGYLTKAMVLLLNDLARRPSIQGVSAETIERAFKRSGFENAVRIRSKLAEREMTPIDDGDGNRPKAPALR